MEKIQASLDLTNKVIEIIFSSLNIKHIDKAKVNQETPLTKGGLELDSVDILELIVNFEQEFGIKLSESEAYAQHFKNIQTVVQFIQAKQSGSI